MWGLQNGGGNISSAMKTEAFSVTLVKKTTTRFAVACVVYRWTLFTHCMEKHVIKMPYLNTFYSFFNLTDVKLVVDVFFSRRKVNFPPPPTLET